MGLKGLKFSESKFIFRWKLIIFRSKKVHHFVNVSKTTRNKRVDTVNIQYLTCSIWIFQTFRSKLSFFIENNVFCLKQIFQNWFKRASILSSAIETLSPCDGSKSIRRRPCSRDHFFKGIKYWKRYYWAKMSQVWKKTDNFIRFLKFWIWKFPF